MATDDRWGGETPDGGVATMHPTTPPRVIRLGIVDDHAHIRHGLGRLFADVPDIVLVGDAASAEDAVRLAVEAKPDVVIMDLRMPEADGVEATRRVLERRPETRIVVLTSFPNNRKVAQALAAGAVGYVLKDDPAEAVLAAVRRAAARRPGGAASRRPGDVAA